MLEARDVCLAAKTVLKELETHSNHCQREDRAQGLPLLPLGPSPSPCWRGVCAECPGLEETVVSSCEVSAPGSWAPAGPELSGQEAGAAWLTVCPWGPDRSPHRNGRGLSGGGAPLGSSRTPPPSPCRPGQPTGHHVSSLLDPRSQVLHASEHAESRHEYFLRFKADDLIS